MALQAEAQPLIEHWQLKQDVHSHEIRVYRRNDVCLAVCGVGKVKAAVAMTHLLNQQEILDDVVALNIGIAGCGEDANGSGITIGDLFLINKITDFATQRDVFPDMLIKSDLSEMPLITYDKPVDRSHDNAPKVGLVDMEASGFFQAASSYLPPHRIVTLKIVSDFLVEKYFDKQFVAELIKNNIPAIELELERYQSFSSCSFDILGEKDQHLLFQIKTALRLTHSQTGALSDWARGYKLRGNNTLDCLNGFTNASVTSKQEGKVQFERLRNILAG